MKNTWMTVAVPVAARPPLIAAIDRKPLGEIDFFGGLAKT
jgi:hypothetical protein